MLMEKNFGLASNMRGYPPFVTPVAVWAMTTSTARSALTTRTPLGNMVIGSEHMETQGPREIDQSPPVVMAVETVSMLNEGKPTLTPREEIPHLQ